MKKITFYFPYSLISTRQGTTLVRFRVFIGCIQEFKTRLDAVAGAESLLRSFLIHRFKSGEKVYTDQLMTQPCEGNAFVALSDEDIKDLIEQADKEKREDEMRVSERLS